MPKLDRLTVAGFKSIRHQELGLRKLNVLIGANGSGKTNLIGVFRLLNEIVNRNLQLSIAKAGGADRFLHFGRKQTPEIALRFDFGRNAYSCRLVPTATDSLVFAEEKTYFRGDFVPEPVEKNLGSGHKETALLSTASGRPLSPISDHVVSAFSSWKIYHFHDTSEAARVKQTGDLDDNERLLPDAGNLAAFLYRLQKQSPDRYRTIVDTIRLVAPFFGGFNLRPNPLRPTTIKLEWQERGSDGYFDAHALSDGTLRFICLATLLLQPKPPTTVLVDEPELGLHPFAITVLADLFRAAAARTQLLVSTQSVTLVNQLDPQDVIVTEREGAESVFRRLGDKEIAGWLEDYALGELWEKNVLGGRPAS